MITTEISVALQALVSNDVVAIPTETVYGLAANAYSEAAVKKIFAVKERPYYNPLIVHIKSLEYLPQVASDIPDIAYKLAEAFWPGPLTLILNKKNTIPDIVTAGKNTVAIRVPRHSVTLDLLSALDFPLAAPSANPFGSISPTTAEHVYNYFGEKVKVILDGGMCEMGIESTIIGFDEGEPVLYRYGSISVEAIQGIVKRLRIKTKDNSSPVAPGMLTSHYAPQKKTFLTDNIQESLAQHAGQKIGLLLFAASVTAKDVIQQEVLSPTGNLAEASKNLYNALHKLDNGEADIIIAEKLPQTGLGISINDRLQRASVKQ